MNLSRIADKCRAADRVIARIDEREKVSCGNGAQRDAATVTKLAHETPAGIPLTEAERAVDKYWAKYLPEIAKLQRAVDGIAVKKGIL